jgi:hypothetical protein
MASSTSCYPIRTRPHRVAIRLAREPVAGYAATATAAQGEAPLGLPVLAETPTLTRMLTRLADVDRTMRAALLDLATLLDSDEVPYTTGIGLETWLGTIGRHTRMDRRFLLRTARLLTRFPALTTAVGDARMSWPQLRGVALVLRDLPPGNDDRADALLARLVDALPDDTDPDVLLQQLRDAIVRWRDEDRPTAEPPASDRLHLQPTLDGTGGTITGEFQGAAFAILDDATAPRADQLDHPGGIAGARAANLLAHLFPTAPRATDPDTDPGNAADRASATASTTTGTAADGPLDHGDGPSTPSVPPVQLVGRLELDTACDVDRVPLELLTRLIGGKLHLTSHAARRLLDTHGATLRTVLVDHGAVVGVGRATRVPPGWLLDALRAIHDTCTGPLCDRPARGAHADHAHPWWPTGPDQPNGRTDIDDLGPLCPTTNRTKEAAGWLATQTTDGVRRWHHPRTGLTTTSIPATWEPPSPSDHRPRRPAADSEGPPPRPG